jgi:hypothetical protein
MHHIGQVEKQRDDLLAALESIRSLRPLGKKASEYSITVESIAAKAIYSAKGCET